MTPSKKKTNSADDAGARAANQLLPQALEKLLPLLRSESPRSKFQALLRCTVLLSRSSPPAARPGVGTSDTCTPTTADRSQFATAAATKAITDGGGENSSDSVALSLESAALLLRFLRPSFLKRVLFSKHRFFSCAGLHFLNALLFSTAAAAALPSSSNEKLAEAGPIQKQATASAGPSAAGGSADATSAAATSTATATAAARQTLRRLLRPCMRAVLKLLFQVRKPNSRDSSRTGGLSDNSKRHSNPNSSTGGSSQAMEGGGESTTAETGQAVEQQRHASAAVKDRQGELRSEKTVQTMGEKGQHDALEGEPLGGQRNEQASAEGEAGKEAVVEAREHAEDEKQQLQLAFRVLLLWTEIVGSSALDRLLLRLTAAAWEKKKLREAQPQQQHQICSKFEALHPAVPPPTAAAAIQRDIREAQELLGESDEEEKFTDEDPAFHEAFSAALDQLDTELEKLHQQQPQQRLHDVTTAEGTGGSTSLMDCGIAEKATATAAEAAGGDAAAEEDELEEKGLELHKKWEESTFEQTLPYSSSDEEEGADIEDFEAAADGQLAATYQAAAQLLLLRAVQQLAMQRLESESQQQQRHDHQQRQLQWRQGRRQQLLLGGEQEEVESIEASLQVIDLLLPSLQKAARESYLQLLLQSLQVQQSSTGGQQLALISLSHLALWLQQAAALSAAFRPPHSTGIGACAAPATAAFKEGKAARQSAVQRKALFRIARGAAAALDLFRREELKTVVAAETTLLKSNLPWKSRSDAFDLAKQLLLLCGLVQLQHAANGPEFLRLSTRLSAVEIRLYFDDVLNAVTSSGTHTDELQKSSKGGNLKDCQSISWKLSVEGRADRSRLAGSAFAFLETAICCFTRELTEVEKVLSASLLRDLFASVKEAVIAAFEFAEDFKGHVSFTMKASVGLAASARVLGLWLAAEPSCYGDRLLKVLPVFCKNLEPEEGAALLPALSHFSPVDWFDVDGVLDMLLQLFLIPDLDCESVYGQICVLHKEENHQDFCEKQCIVSALLAAAVLSPLVDSVGQHVGLRIQGSFPACVSSSKQQLGKSGCSLLAWHHSLQPLVNEQLLQSLRPLAYIQQSHTTWSGQQQHLFQLPFPTPEVVDSLEVCSNCEDKNQARKLEGLSVCVLVGSLAFLTFILQLQPQQHTVAEEKPSIPETGAAASSMQEQRTEEEEEDSINACSSSTEIRDFFDWWKQRMEPLKAATEALQPVAFALERQFIRFDDWDESSSLAALLHMSQTEWHTASGHAGTSKRCGLEAKRQDAPAAPMCLSKNIQTHNTSAKFQTETCFSTRGVDELDVDCVKKFYIWKSEITSAAAALVGTLSSERAALQLLSSLELLALWESLVKQFVVLAPSSSKALLRVGEPAHALWFRSARVIAVGLPHHPLLQLVLHNQLTAYQNATGKAAKDLVCAPPDKGWKRQQQKYQHRRTEDMSESEEDEEADFTEEDALLVQHLRTTLMRLLV